MIGIVPGHWIMGAEFTATSMIGMIALGGIIVRQSILIVEFVKIEVAKGRPVREAAVAGAEIRMRPIMITSLTLMAGAWAIIFDPIFQGMAVSLLFGAGVATLMAVLIIPLGCISLRRRFYLEEAADSAELVLSSKYEEIEGEAVEAVEEQVAEYKTPLWMRIYSGVIGLFGWIFLILRSVFIMLKMAVGAILGKFGGSDEPPPPPSSPPPSSPPSSPPPPPASSAGNAAPVTETAQEEKVEAEEKTKPQGTAEPEAEAEVRETAAAEKKAAQKKEAAPVEKAAAVKKAPVSVKRAPAKKPAASKDETEEAKPEVKETTAEEKISAEESESTRKPAPAKKAPSKKTSPRGRRGIRLKVDND
jgi:hypothetical protein